MKGDVIDLVQGKDGVYRERSLQKQQTYQRKKQPQKQPSSHSQRFHFRGLSAQIITFKQGYNLGVQLINNLENVLNRLL